MSSSVVGVKNSELQSIETQFVGLRMVGQMSLFKLLVN